MNSIIFKSKTTAHFLITAFIAIFLLMFITSCNGDLTSDDVGTIAVYNTSSSKVITDIWIGKRLSEFDTLTVSFEHKVADAKILPTQSYYLALESGYYALKVTYRSNTLFPDDSSDCSTLIRRLDKDATNEARFDGTSIGWED